MKREEGFTLVEVSITLLVIGIVSMLVLPRMSSFLSGNPETVARRLQLTVRSCREHSIMKHKPYRIVLDLEGQFFFVQTLTENNPNELTFEKDRTILHRTVKIPRDVRIMDVSTPLTGIIKEGEAYIMVLQDGLFPGAVVHLIDDEKQKYTLTFRPLTGRLVYEEGYLFTEIEQKAT